MVLDALTEGEERQGIHKALKDDDSGVFYLMVEGDILGGLRALDIWATECLSTVVIGEGKGIEILAILSLEGVVCLLTDGFGDCGVYPSLMEVGI